MSDKLSIGSQALKRKADGRRSTRFPTSFPGELRASGRNLPVNVRDISREGVLIEGASLPGAGREVVLTAKQLDVGAKVVWQRDPLCGLEFVSPIDPLEIVRQNVPELARLRRRSED